MTFLRRSLFVAALSLAASAVSAHDLSNTDGPTLGQAMASGLMSQTAAEQFVAGSGFSLQEAQGMPLSKIAHEKWGNT